MDAKACGLQDRPVAVDSKTVYTLDVAADLLVGSLEDCRGEEHGSDTLSSARVELSHAHGMIELLSRHGLLRDICALACGVATSYGATELRTNAP